MSERRRSRLQQGQMLLTAAALGLAAWALANAIDNTFAPPALVALAFGVVLQPVIRADQFTRDALGSAGNFMLRAGIVVLGVRVGASAGSILDWRVALGAMILVTVGILSVWAVARRLGLPADIAGVVTAAVSICGATAAVVAGQAFSAYPARTAQVVVLVTVSGFLSTAFILICGSIFQLDTMWLAVWAGYALPEVAHVGLAGDTLGNDAAPLAIAAKMGRVILLPLAIILVAALGVRRHREGVSLLPPWYVAAFLVVATVSGFAPLPPNAVAISEDIFTCSLCAALVICGASISWDALWNGGLQMSVATAVGVLMILTIAFVISSRWHFASAN